MRTETVSVTVPVFRTVEDENGEFTAVEQIGEETSEVTTLYADVGMCIVRCGDSTPLGTKVTLGSNEKADSYTEATLVN